MIVIYHDVGGTHSSAVAANIHINKLPLDRLPDKSELLNLPTFDKITKSQIGHLIFIGTDEFGCRIYTISRQYRPELVTPAIEDMYKILHGSTEGLLLVATHPAVNNLMRIGGFSSRRLNMVAFGRPIVTYGTLRSYLKLIDIVKHTKDQIRESIGH